MSTASTAAASRPRPRSTSTPTAAPETGSGAAHRGDPRRLVVPNGNPLASGGRIFREGPLVLREPALDRPGLGHLHLAGQLGGAVAGIAAPACEVRSRLGLGRQRD